MFYDNKHSPEVQEWYYRMINDPVYFEKSRYIDTINDYNSIIEELQKLYEQTPVTQRYARPRIISGMRKSKRELAKTQAEYDKFKEYKTRTAIST
jgi:hypothetical protein